MLLFMKCKINRILPDAYLTHRQFDKYQLMFNFSISCIFFSEGPWEEARHSIAKCPTMLYLLGQILQSLSSVLYIADYFAF